MSKYHWIGMALLGITLGGCEFARDDESAGGSSSGSVGVTPPPVVAPAPQASVSRAPTGSVARDINDATVTETLRVSGAGSSGLEFRWQVVAYDNQAPTDPSAADPDGSMAIPPHRFTNPTARATGFIAGAAGRYLLELIVGNGAGEEDRDRVLVFVQEDADGDGITDANDADRDGDGFLNADDAFPDEIASHLDSNMDGTGNYFTVDVDGDGTNDEADDQPLDPDVTTLTAFAEANEPGTTNSNDGITVSDAGGTVPTILTGSINAVNNRPDLDYFRVEWTAGNHSLRLTGSNPAMSVTLSVVTATGAPIASTMANLSPAAGDSALSVLIPEDGTFYVVATDRSGTSNTDWNYQIQVFRDTDLDGVGDDLEQALDSNHLSPDSDGDTIPDFKEIFDAIRMGSAGFDLDGDGIPAWWDRDSDGDTIPDMTEHYLANERPDLDAAGIARLNDADQDGTDNYLDVDSDNNVFAVDMVEVGPDPLIPLDTDGDLTPDFLDLDDDDDGALDVNETDASRIEALVLADENQLRLGPLFNSDRDTEAFCLPGDNMLILGSILPNDVSNSSIVLRGGETILNIGADGLTADGVQFTCPATIGAGLFDVFLIQDGERAGSLPLTVATGDLPYITGVTVDGAARTMTLVGGNLAADLGLEFVGASSSFNNTGGSAIEVTVPYPAEAERGLLTVTTVAGTSNPFWVDLARTVTGTVSLPAGSTVDVTELDVAWSPLDEVHPAADGSFATEVNQLRASVLTGLLERPSSTEDNPAFAAHLQSVILPGDSATELSAASTALALIWQGLGVDALLPETNWADARTALAALPEVATLASRLETELVSDPFILGASPVPASIADVSRPALLAGAELLSAQFGPAPAPQMAAQRGKFGDPAEVTPAEVDDISAYERGDTGHLTVENDTQLYLSAKMTAADGSVLQRHITGFSGMAGPQGYGLLFWATPTEYDQPNGRNVLLEVIAAGADRDFEPRSYNERQVWKWIYIRTAIERVMWPVIAEVLPLDKNVFIEIVFVHAPTLVDTVVNQVLAGNVSGAFGSMLNLFFQDVASLPPGPITQALAKRYGRGLAERALARIAAKIGAKFVPGIGQIALAVEIAGHVNNGANAAKAIADIVATDQTIHYDVKFPLSIEEVIPAAVKPDGSNRAFVIRGSGFSPITRGLIFRSTLRPEVVFTDANGLERTVQPSFITADGTRMLVTLDGYYLDDDLEGPLKVRVNHPTDNSDAFIEQADAVELVGDVVITSIEPNSGAAGSAATVFGSGFAKLSSDNEITVGGVNALIVNASSTSLDILIPASLDAGTYPVQARVREDGVFGMPSNSVDYEVVEGDVSITLCDDGGLKDDAFTLFVNGALQGTLFARPGNFCSTFNLNLAPNTSHTASLLGVEAPDNVGTYSVDFSGVTNLTGSPLSGNDLVPGVRKFYSFDVPAPSAAAQRSVPANNGAPLPRINDPESR